MTRYSPAVDALLADHATLEQLRSKSLEELFSPHLIADRDAALACQAGIHLRFDDLDGAHRISQDLATPEGSFWHGIVHRREGDYWNAKYWFRRVGPHPVFDDLTKVTGEKWDPFAFVDRVESGKDAAECGRLQDLEWRALFDFCWRAAIAAAN